MYDDVAWDMEEVLRLRCTELVVSGGLFWFTASPKHASYAVETRGMGIDELEAALDSPEDAIFHGDNARDLKVMVEDAAGESTVV